MSLVCTIEVYYLFTNFTCLFTFLQIFTCLFTFLKMFNCLFTFVNELQLFVYSFGMDFSYLFSVKSEVHGV